MICSDLRKSPVGCWLCWPIIILVAGCAVTDRPVGLAELESYDIALRIRAIKWAGENKITAAVPLLVDRLAEQDRSVRFFAINALQRITGTNHGFDYKAGTDSRNRAIQRWRRVISKSSRPSDSDGGEPQGSNVP